MKPSIEKLQKFFKLEAGRNYDNKAVMGGLQSMLAGWELEARADELPEELIQAVVIRLRDYQRLSEASRKETLHGIWARVQRETDAQGLEVAAAPQAESQPEAPAAPAEPEKVAAQKPPPPPKEEIQPEKQQPAPKPERAARPEGPSAALNASVTVLPRVGDHKAKTLNRIGIQTLADMLYYFPKSVVEPQSMIKSFFCFKRQATSHSMLDELSDQIHWHSKNLCSDFISSSLSDLRPSAFILPVKKISLC